MDGRAAEHGRTGAGGGHDKEGFGCRTGTGGGRVASTASRAGAGRAGGAWPARLHGVREKGIGSYTLVNKRLSGEGN